MLLANRTGKHFTVIPKDLPSTGKQFARKDNSDKQCDIPTVIKR